MAWVWQGFLGWGCSEPCSLDLACTVISAMKQDEDRSTLTTHIPNGNNYREKILGSGPPWWGLGQGQRAQLELQGWEQRWFPWQHQEAERWAH